MESKINSSGSVKSDSLRLTVLTGLFAAVSAALGFALIALPNIEMITAGIFISGLLLGPLRGLMVGLLGELIFVALNPMGMSFPPLLAAQLASMAVAGLIGGYMCSAVKRWNFRKRVILIGLVGFILTLNYDFWTTMSFPLSAGFGRQQILTTLKLGIPFAIPHLLGNTLIFALVVPLVYARLNKMLPLVLIFATTFYLAACPTAFAGQPLCETGSESWEYMYYEDTGDILGAVPGFFLYDLSLLGQPLYFRHGMGLTQTLLYGIPIKSHYFGICDFNLLPPGYLNDIKIVPGCYEGIFSADGLVACTPRFFFPETPYSRVNYRDGYYGLGVADFILSQRLHKRYGFQIGGRISEFNGRLENSQLDGVNLRSLVHWRNDEGTKVDFVCLSNRNKAQITHGNDHRNLIRTDIFLTAEQPMGDEPVHLVLHYQNAEENYGGKPDPSEEVYDLKIRRNFKFESLEVQPAIYLNRYRVRSENGFSESQAAGTASLKADYRLSEKFSVDAGASLTMGRDVLPGGLVGCSYSLGEDSKIAALLAQSSESPAPYYRANYSSSSGLFLPGTSSWRLPQEAEIMYNADLEPETVSSARLFADFKAGDFIRVKPSAFIKRIENPIGLVSASGDSIFTWDNYSAFNLPGAEAELSLGRWKGFGLRVSYSYQNPENGGDFIPMSWGWCWLDFQKRAFEDQLLYTIGVHGRYIGERSGQIKGVYGALGDDNVWGARVTFNVANFTLFWGNENIFSKEYEIIPGYPMIHREEVWGINWIFWD